MPRGGHAGREEGPAPHSEQTRHQGEDWKEPTAIVFVDLIAWLDSGTPASTLRWRGMTVALMFVRHDVPR